MYTEKPGLHRRQKNFKPGNLRTISLDVTARCNMKCGKCYAQTFAEVKPVELEALEKTADELYESGVFHYVLQGGEPLMDPRRLEAILKLIHPDETYINIVSNGWEMTPEAIRWLKGLKVDKIAFSLDSGIRQEHDSGRLEGSYARVMEGIENTLQEGLLASISIVVTHESLYSDGFNKAYEFAKQKGIRMDVQISEPVGRWDGKKEYLITPEGASYIKQLQINGPVLSNGQRMINRDIYMGEFDHCPAGTEFMAISADGNLLPCNFLQFTLGNIRDKSVTQMRQDLLSSEWFNGRHRICICGEDHEFIDKFIMPYVGHNKPLDAYKVFNLKEKKLCQNSTVLKNTE